MEEKSVSKQSFVYKVCYGMARRWEKPDHGDICSLFWRFCFFFFIAWPTILLILAVFNIFSLPLGYLVRVRDADQFDLFMTKPIPNWPFNDDGVPLYLHRAVPAVCAYVLYWVAIFKLNWDLGVGITGMGIILGGVALVVLLIALSEDQVKKEGTTLWLAKEKVVSFKQKHCTLVNFT